MKQLSRFRLSSAPAAEPATNNAPHPGIPFDDLIAMLYLVLRKYPDIMAEVEETYLAVYNKAQSRSL